MSVVVTAPEPVRVARTPPFAQTILRALPGLLVLAVLWFVPASLQPVTRQALAIAVAAMVLWATVPWPQAWTGAGALFLFVATGVAPASQAISGFWNSTTQFLLGALLLGRAVSGTGLARRLAFRLASALGSSYSGLLLAFITTDFLLTFLIPSGIARVSVLAAIVAGLCESLGLPRQDRAARGLMLAVTCSASIFDKMVLAGTSSILASGIIERLGGVSISYGRWFLAYVPCDLLAIAGCWAIVRWLFPDASGELARGRRYFEDQYIALGPMTRGEWRAIGIVGCAIALWLTDFLHGLQPAYVALACASAAMLPGVGVLSVRDLARLPFTTLVFTATALSISTILDRSGALATLTSGMVGWMPAVIHGPASASLVLYWTAFAYHLLLGAQNLMITATLPAVVTMGQSLDFSPAVVGMIWVFGTAGKIFPYQSGVLMVGYSYGYFDGRDLMKVGLLLALLESIILFFLVPLYWPFVGLL